MGVFNKKIFLIIIITIFLLPNINWADKYKVKRWLYVGIAEVS
ncbi:MAG: hypothetical protein N2323_05320 [candidate division WOR-3 bacterium]|nr:hypothetical protein [candidate division WOR-3 bacterium]